MCGVERDAPVYPHSRTLTRPQKKREMYGTGDWEMWLPGPQEEEEGVVGREEVGMEGIGDARRAVLGEEGRQGNLSFFFSYFFFHLHQKILLFTARPCVDFYFLVAKSWDEDALVTPRVN